MSLIENVQFDWIRSQVDKEAKSDFSRSFNTLTDRLSQAFSLDDAIYDNNAALTRGVAGTLNRFGSYGDQLGAGDYLHANLDKMQNVLLEELASPKSNGTNKIWVGGISLRIVDDVTQGWGKDGTVTREQALGKLILGAARVKALSRLDGIPETYATARSEATNAVKIIEKAAAILFDTETGTAVDMTALLDKATHPNKGLARKLGMGSLVVATSACTAVVPTEQSPTFDPPIIATEKPAVIETVAAPTLVPSPEAGVKRVEVTAVEYSGEELKEKLKSYEEAKVYSYDSDGGLIVLEGIDKPTGKAAFNVDGKEYITAFGMNGASFIMYKDGDRFVAAEFDNLRAEDGSRIENAFGYHLYVDPATRQIAEKIDAKMWRIPVFTIFKDILTEKNILLHFNLDDLLLGDAGFKQVISSGKPADAMLSLISPELFKDIDAAPSFVQEINFEGDWKVIFDEDGSILLIDAKNGDEIGEFVTGAWSKSETAETVTMSGVILTQDENGVLTIKEVTGTDADTKAENRAKVDPAAWGCENCTMVKDKTGTHIVAEGQNIALWVGTEWVWDGQALASLEGGNPLFELAKTYPTKDDGTVRQTPEVNADAVEIRALADSIGGKSNYTIYLYDGEDRTKAIVARLLVDAKRIDLNTLNTATFDGIVIFKTVTGKLVKMKFKDVEVTVRRFN